MTLSPTRGLGAGRATLSRAQGRWCLHLRADYIAYAGVYVLLWTTLSIHLHCLDERV